MKYYLMDLERSIQSGEVHYWKASRRGYTKDIEEAGEYTEETALEIIATDFDRRTVMIPKSVVTEIMSI